MQTVLQDWDLFCFIYFTRQAERQVFTHLSDEYHVFIVSQC